MQTHSALRTLSRDGQVTLIDHSENRINVPPEKLPFMASGGMQTQPGEFSMTALGPNNNGILETQL